MKKLYRASAKVTSIKSTVNLKLNDGFKLLICRTVFLLFLAVGTITVHGATFVVTKTADTNDGACDADCSLREAIVAANSAVSDDVVGFDPATFNVARTITLTGSHLTVSNMGSLSINGPGASLLSINGNNATRVFVVEAGANLSLRDISITNGRSTSIIAGRFAGGGIHSQGSLTITTSSIIGNWAAEAGGGIYQLGGTLSITSSNISNNTLGNGTGGGIHSEGTLSIVNSTVNNNNNGGWGGGGILVIGNASINGTTISGNSAGTGAGVRTENANLVFSNSTIASNNGGSAPGLQINQGSSTINGSVFSGNVATGVFGGGISNNGGSVTMTDTLVTGNSSTNSGCGGVCNGPFNGVQGQLSILRTTISNNTSHQGGGVHNNDSMMTISDSTITANSSANGDGGGIYNNSLQGSLQISNTTVTNNNGRQGGGIFNFQGPFSINHVSITGNASTLSGGGLAGSGPITLKSSLIGDNVNSGGTTPDISGTHSSQGYNLIENVSSAIIIGTTTGNILNRDPQIIPLRNNGGPTNTIALQPTSPAIDAGDPTTFPATDQRGVTRPQDGDLNGTSRADIGAYERQVFASTVTKTADTNDGVCDTDCSLREAIAITNAATNPDNAIVFDASVFSQPQAIILVLGELRVNNNRTLVIYGNGVNMLTISGNNQSRVFYVSPLALLMINGTTVTGGNGVGAVSGFGGGIYNSRGILIVSNSTVIGNAANSGGGIYSGENQGGNSQNGTLRVINSTITTNNGGGVVITGNGGEFINSIVTGNSREASGAGIYAFGVSTLNFVNSRATYNSGGGIHIEASVSATISQSNISSNTGGSGIQNAGNLNIQRSLISANSTPDRGGGVLNELGGSVAMANTTVSGNFANIHGGGIFNHFSSSVSLDNSTIVNNTTNGIGGGVFNSLNATVTVRNTIVANNGAVIQSPDFERVLTSLGFNLIKNTSGTTITGTTTGNILGQDPLLDPILKFNGGPTATHALRLGSPAIDKGSAITPAITTDQRGLLRPYDSPSVPNASGGNGSDIGAFERQANDVSGLPIFDFDGDGKTDISIFRPAPGEWWYQPSSDGQVPALQFGVSTDKITPGDFTGDGKTDIAFWRPSTGFWFVLRSEDFSFFAFPFGATGDVPVPADYDGDGKADAAVFRPSNSTWFISRSTGGTTIAQFGASGDQPVVADYDGDGKADIAIFRPNGANGAEWWYVKSGNNQTAALQFGASTDKAVQGDYTGDGKADVAFWRPSNGFWFILRSEDFSFFAFPFGTTGDIPSPGDYDGDGKFDACVFRPAGSTWFANRLTAGVLIQQFGAAGDLPVPNAFVR